MMKSYVLNRESFWIETCFESGQKCFWILKKKKIFFESRIENRKNRFWIESLPQESESNRIVGHQKIHSPSSTAYADVRLAALLIDRWQNLRMCKCSQLFEYIASLWIGLWIFWCPTIWFDSDSWGNDSIQNRFFRFSIQIRYFFKIQKHCCPNSKQVSIQNDSRFNT